MHDLLRSDNYLNILVKLLIYLFCLLIPILYLYYFSLFTRIRFIRLGYLF